MIPGRTVDALALVDPGIQDLQKMLALGERVGQGSPRNRRGHRDLADPEALASRTGPGTPGPVARRTTPRTPGTTDRLVVPGGLGRVAAPASWVVPSPAVRRGDTARMARSSLVVCPGWR